jgi:hypothetical protein
VKKKMSRGQKEKEMEYLSMTIIKRELQRVNQVDPCGIVFIRYNFAKNSEEKIARVFFVGVEPKSSGKYLWHPMHLFTGIAGEVETNQLVFYLTKDADCLYDDGEVLIYKKDLVAE